MRGINGLNEVVPLVFPITQDGAEVSAIFSMKNYDKADIYIMIGTVTKAGAVTLSQGAKVAAAATSLSFTKYFSTGFILDYTGGSVNTPAAEGETVTGSGGGVGYVKKDLGGTAGRLICYAYNGTTFVTGETLTFSGGKTAVANGIQKNEDIMVARTAASDTFNAAAVAAKTYCIPINGAMLTEGNTSVKVSIADMDTTGVVAFAVLGDPRYIGSPGETAIYD